jgi:uncharacterized protein YxeA
MKKTIFIGLGILAVAGVGYFFFKNKKKQTALLGTPLAGGTTSSTSGSTSSTSGTTQSTLGTTNAGVSTTPSAKPIELQPNYDKAKDIYLKIKASEVKLSKTTSSLEKSLITSIIKKLNDSLLNLGYYYKKTTNELIYFAQ